MTSRGILGHRRAGGGGGAAAQPVRWRRHHRVVRARITQRHNHNPARNRRDVHPTTAAAADAADAEATDHPTTNDDDEDEAAASAAATRDVVEKDTREWLERIVMGLNLCPFARAALPGTEVLVTRATTMDALREDVSRELHVLKEADVATPRTTLIVLPPKAVAALDAATFEGFMEGCYAMAEEETRAVTASLSDEVKTRLDLIGELVEIVPFHPRATFGAVDAADEAGV